MTRYRAEPPNPVEELKKKYPKIVSGMVEHIAGVTIIEFDTTEDLTDTEVADIEGYLGRKLRRIA